MAGHLAHKNTAHKNTDRQARADNADQVANLAEVEQRILASLRPIYTNRRAIALASVETALEIPAQAEWDGLAAELHALAGTAAHFGEDIIGELSRLIEGQIRRDEPVAQRLISLQQLRVKLLEAG